MEMLQRLGQFQCKCQLHAASTVPPMLIVLSLCFVFPAQELYSGDVLELLCSKKKDLKTARAKLNVKRRVGKKHCLPLCEDIVRKAGKCLELLGRAQLTTNTATSNLSRCQIMSRCHRLSVTSA